MSANGALPSKSSFENITGYETLTESPIVLSIAFTIKAGVELNLDI